MKQHLNQSLQSRSKIKKIFDQEQEVSQNFKVSNFYSNHRFNILELKNRLEQFKKNHNQILPPPQKAEQSSKILEFQAIHPVTNKYKESVSMEAQIQKQKITLPSAHRDKLAMYNQRGNKFKQAAHRTVTPEYDSLRGKKKYESSGYRITKEANRYNNNNKIRTATGNRVHMMNQHPRSIQSQYQKQSSKMSKGKDENLDLSKFSNSSNKKSSSGSINLNLQGKILVYQKSQLIDLQKYINVLWSHYQLLTKILLGLREGQKYEKNAIVKYVQDVCSDKFEFVRTFLNTITRQGAQKNEFMFVKRLKRAIVISRLYQNMAIIYVGLIICLHKQPQAHLVNFVGYCCSNITFLIRFIYLLHGIDQQLKFSAPIGHIMNIITQFEHQSYKQSISKIQDVVLRMQHNNQIISIVQGRLCNSMDKDFQKIIVAFLKNVDLNSKPFYQYSHYIYQFLAYQLAKKNIVGQFSFLQMAPSPYLEDLPEQKTLVVEPWQVLLAFKGNTTYIRSYCDTFLRQIGKYWNIVYWTDLMPEFIDNLVDKLPSGKVLYRYHCRFENQRYLKLLWRLGCDSDNTIIIDREQVNFKYDKDMGIALPWLGKRKDTKLLDLLGQLHNFISEDTPLRKVFPLIKQNLLTKKKESRVVKISEPKEQMQSLMPRAVMKSKKVSRMSNYQ